MKKQIACGILLSGSIFLTHASSQNCSAKDIYPTPSAEQPAVDEAIPELDAVKDIAQASEESGKQEHHCPCCRHHSRSSSVTFADMFNDMIEAQESFADIFFNEPVRHTKNLTHATGSAVENKQVSFDIDESDPKTFKVIVSLPGFTEQDTFDVTTIKRDGQETVLKITTKKNATENEKIASKKSKSQYHVASSSSSYTSFQSERGKSATKRELAYSYVDGKFDGSVTLPSDVVQDKYTMKFRDGKLTIGFDREAPKSITKLKFTSNELKPEEK